MRRIPAGLAALLLGGCLMREGNPLRVGSSPCLWEFPGEEFELRVSGPVPFEDLRDFVRERESEGWKVCGCEPVSLPEDAMVNAAELDRPAPPRRRSWTFEIPRAMDDGMDPPAAKRREPDGALVDSVLPYLDEGVRPHRQKYLLILGRWR